jgi:hypothetical protein
LQRYAAAFHACRIAWTAESQRMRGEAQ